MCFAEPILNATPVTLLRPPDDIQIPNCKSKTAHLAGNWTCGGVQTVKINLVAESEAWTGLLISVTFRVTSEKERT